jgi:predicted transcriptional regulator
MAEKIAISSAESVVMEALWKKQPQSAEEVIVALARQQDWQDTTVKTLLNRLLQKGAIKAAKEGRRYLYWPLMTREHWLTQESKSLLDRLYGGKIAPLVAHFSKHRKISQRDLLELKKLIESLPDAS